MREVTRAVAFDPAGWTGERQAQVVALFDTLAGEWHTRDSPGRDAPLRDALNRGLSAADAAAAGPALEAAMAAVTTTEVPMVVVPDVDAGSPASRRNGGDRHSRPRRSDRPERSRWGGQDRGRGNFFGRHDDDLPANDPPTGTTPVLSSGFGAGFGTRVPRRVCVDIGAGSGLYSATLAERFPTLVSVDLSGGMLRAAPAEPALRVQADASVLPVVDASVDALVLANAFLFPAEVERVLAADGVVVWVSSRGADTPIHLTAGEVDAVLPGRWDGVSSQAGWGTWSVHWRAVV